MGGNAVGWYGMGERRVVAGFGGEGFKGGEGKADDVDMR